MIIRLPGTLVALTACLLCMPITSDAAVTGGNVTTSGKIFQSIAPPANVGNNNQQNNNTLYAFDEKQSILLISDLTVNISPGGGSAIIPAGTWVSSHYVFYDPSSSLAVIDGTVDFADEVLGIITDLAELNASDFLGSDTTSYNSPSLRGLEAVDSASISGTNQIAVHMEAGSPGDYVRVITLPEPTSALLLLPVMAASLHRRTPSLA